MSVPDRAVAPEQDTIVATSTAPGRAGIGIVRLSGPAAWTIASRLVRTDTPLEHGRARFSTVLDPDAPEPFTSPGLDEAVVTAYRAPRSYTGEDVVEIAAHGSPVVLQALLLSSVHAGARLARPGEFTERAFLGGRLDLTQAEAVRDLIDANTLDQARTAARQLGGSLARRVAPLKEQLLHLIALLEAGMDFATGELDDVDTVPPGQIRGSLHALLQPLRVLEQSFRSGYLRRNGASLALIGLANAGKSSLFNRLLDRDRAIVSAVAGTTRDTLEEMFSLRGIPVRIVDTAGLRDAEQAGEIERMGIVRSREALADADFVLLLHDRSVPLTSEEYALASELQARPHVLVNSKGDLPGNSFGWSGSQAITISVRTGQGLEDLQTAMLAQLGAGDAADAGGLNTVRQHGAVQAAVAALDAALSSTEEHMPHEVLLVDLHAALAALDELTGQTTADDILARIFSTFCIGK